MKPVYFPYTFVPEEIIQAGAVCFDQMAVYMPGEIDVPEIMTAAEKNGWLDIRAPEKGDEERIRSAVNDYKQWANAHADGDGIRPPLQGHADAKAPFFNESSLMKIKEDIQRGIKETKPFRDTPDLLFSSRVFLTMSHEYDMQHYDIHQRLRQLDNREHGLFKDLQGEDADTFGAIKGTSPVDTPFDFMVPERLEAWSVFMLHCMDSHAGGGFFVTGNRSVFSYIIENFNQGEMLFEMENIPIASGNTEAMQNWRNSLLRNIQQYVETPWPVEEDNVANPPIQPEGKKTVALHLYIVPGEIPAGLFSRFYPHAQSDSHKGGKAEKIRNTLFGLLDVAF